MCVLYFCSVCVFFKQKTAYELRISDWSSDVCSSDLAEGRRLCRDDQVGRRDLPRRRDAGADAGRRDPRPAARRNGDGGGMMRAVQLRAPASLDNLTPTDLPDPGDPGPGEIRVRLAASSLNFHDFAVVAGMIPTVDGRIPMSDGAGTVEAVGEGV